MWMIALALVAGVLVGQCVKLSAIAVTANNWLARAGLTLLLLNMGARLTSDPEIRSSLGQTGLSASVLAIAAIIGSIACVHILDLVRKRLNTLDQICNSIAGEEAAQGGDRR